VVPSQWKSACIVRVPKIAAPTCPAGYRPIFITSILSRLVERIVVKEYIYPSFLCSPPSLDLSDQFALQPTASTTAALVHLLQTITNHLRTNPYVIVYAMDFSKAFDSVQHKSVLDKFSQLEKPDHIYNWIQDFFKHHSHCKKFGDKSSIFRTSWQASFKVRPLDQLAAYTVTASDLRPVIQGNLMHEYADDTYLVVLHQITTFVQLKLTIWTVGIPKTTWQSIVLNQSKSFS
jgi:Reverse transcriptase (RNA-dependent DNA polymerase)